MSLGRCTLLRCAVLLAAAQLVLAGAAADAKAPAHYLVFTVEETGEIRPVFHRRVTLADSPASKSEEQLALESTAAPRDAAVYALALVDGDGQVLFRDSAIVPTSVRGEFHGEIQKDGTTSIEAHRILLTRSAFVVRLPEAPGARLVLEGPDPDKASFSFSLDALEKSAKSLPLARLAALPAKAVTPRAANSGNRVDLLVLGDGYTEAEADKFAADAARTAEGFFSVTPYREYRNFVNFTALSTPSAQSGADHPPYNASCQAGSATCCADPAMQSDPRRGTFVDTVLDATFCAGGLFHRALVVDEAAAFAVAAAAPDWDRILVLVNDPTYGGIGFPLISVASLHSSTLELVQHEYAHSFTDLADEYTDTFVPVPCDDARPAQACEANATNLTDRARIKWAPWISPTTPIPTPANEGYGNVPGLFVGTRHVDSGMYRPHESCAMRVLSAPFRDVCSQEYVLRLYRGGWGRPAGGIDLIEPGSESPRPGEVPASSSINFSVRLLQPQGTPPALRWSVDGVEIPSATRATFTFRPPTAGTHTVELRVRDMTPLVHPEMAGTDLESTRRWTVASNPETLEVSLNAPTPAKSGP